METNKGLISHAHIKPFMLEVTRIAESPRSSLAKNALMTIGEFSKQLPGMIDS
jgi:hypothetical protein